jgi:hypothetical protein
MSRYGQSGKMNAQVGPSRDELYSEAGSPGSTYSYDPLRTVANDGYRELEQDFGPITRGLLVIVGAEVFNSTEITQLSGRGQLTGRLAVNVDVDPPVEE